MKNKKRTLTPLLCALVLCGAVCGGLALGCAALPTPEIVARVDGLPLERGEYELAQARHRSGVISWFQTAYGAVYDGDFWTRDYGGVTPKDLLRERALADCVQVKVIQALALERGLLEDPSYSALLAGMEAENRRRRDAIAAGAVVYGASAYTAETYYAYVNSNLALDLRRALEEDVLARTEGDLRAWYAANAQRFRTPDQISFRRISVGFDDGGRDAALERIGRAAGELAAGRDFEAVAASCGGAGAEEQMGPDNIRSYSKYEEAVYNAALALSPGGVSAPFESGGACVILYCTARTPGTVPDFDQIRSEAEVLFSNEVFDEFLQNKIQEATISWVG